MLKRKQVLQFRMETHMHGVQVEYTYIRMPRDGSKHCESQNVMQGTWTVYTNACNHTFSAITSIQYS